MCLHTRGILLALLIAATAFGSLSLLHAVSAPSADGASIHRTVLLANLLIGVLLAVIAAAAAMSLRSWPARILLVLVGVLVVWSAMLAGIGGGYRAWQAMPDPPEEAFADGGPLLFGLFLGWVPGLVVMALGLTAMWIAQRVAVPTATTRDPGSAFSEGDAGSPG